MLDQGEFWVATDGCKYPIESLPEKMVVAMVDYSLANAKYLREAWAIGTRQTFDPDERARRWMLNRPAIRAMLRQLIRRERERIEDDFKEAANDNEQS